MATVNTSLEEILITSRGKVVQTKGLSKKVCLWAYGLCLYGVATTATSLSQWILDGQILLGVDGSEDCKDLEYNEFLEEMITTWSQEPTSIWCHSSICEFCTSYHLSASKLPHSASARSEISCPLVEHMKWIAFAPLADPGKVAIGTRLALTKVVLAMFFTCCTSICCKTKRTSRRQKQRSCREIGELDWKRQNEI